jgi:hypothetical protein
VKLIFRGELLGTPGCTLNRFKVKSNYGGPEESDIKVVLYFKDFLPAANKKEKPSHFLLVVL